ncbi:MAG: TetR/AcrR family transcriptional regulator [Pseudomonadota bacterium]
MARPRQTTAAQQKTMRKAPVQGRAQHTVRMIYQATAQIIENEGLAGLSTNKIARVAGFSVGTLYQYFPSKEAVLQAMIADERQRVMDEMRTVLLEVAAGRQEPLEGLRLRIRALIQAFGLGNTLNRAIVKLAWQMDHVDTVAQAQREGAEHVAIAWAQVQAREPGLRAPTPALLFVATRAVIGTIRAASLENSPLLGTQAFEDELVRMVWELIREH